MCEARKCYCRTVEWVRCQKVSVHFERRNIYSIILLVKYIYCVTIYLFLFLLYQLHHKLVKVKLGSLNSSLGPATGYVYNLGHCIWPLEAIFFFWKMRDLEILLSNSLRMWEVNLIWGILITICTKYMKNGNSREGNPTQKILKVFIFYHPIILPLWQ